MSETNNHKNKSQSFLRNTWEYISPFARYLLLTAMVLVGLVLLVRFLGLQPPDEFTIATGRQGGAYFAFAEQYQERFAKEGYTVNIRETAGSVETLEFLNAGEVDVGFVQNVVYDDIRSDPELSTLASLFYEAMWVFYRDDLAVQPAQCCRSVRAANQHRRGWQRHTNIVKRHINIEWYHRGK